MHGHGPLASSARMLPRLTPLGTHMHRTKPADAAGSPNYVVRALAFSSDSTKLAVAQSDNIVFVYRVGESWSDKKSICNKFLQVSHMTRVSAAWLGARQGSLNPVRGQGRFAAAVAQPRSGAHGRQVSGYISVTCNPIVVPVTVRPRDVPDMAQGP